MICTPHPILIVIKSRKMRWAVHVVCMGGVDVYAGFWWGNLRKTDHLEEPGVWEDNIKMDLQEVGCGGMDWFDVAQDRDRWRALVTAVMSIRVPYYARNLLTS
jgi:hypothetical protein